MGFKMTVNHDVVSSSLTGAAKKKPIATRFVAMGNFYYTNLLDTLRHLYLFITGVRSRWIDNTAQGFNVVMYVDLRCDLRRRMTKEFGNRINIMRSIVEERSAGMPKFMGIQNRDF